MRIRANNKNRNVRNARRVRLTNLKAGDTFKFTGGNAVYVAGTLHDGFWTSPRVDSYTNLLTGEVFDAVSRMVVKVKLADTSIL